MLKPWTDDRLAANGRAVKDNFADWFGDSQVIDPAGSPLVVYHGTSADITEFDPSKGQQVAGVFMTPDKSYVNSFGSGGRGGGGNVMPLFVSIQNPRNISLTNWNFESLDAAMSDGNHDGVIVRNDDGSVYVVVAHESNQIKSAIGNSGLYLKDSPSITDDGHRLALIQAHQAKLAIKQMVHAKKQKVVPC